MSNTALPFHFSPFIHSSKHSLETGYSSCEVSLPGNLFVQAKPEQMSAIISWVSCLGRAMNSTLVTAASLKLSWLLLLPFA